MRKSTARFWVIVFITIIVVFIAIYELPFSGNWQIYWIFIFVAIALLCTALVWIFREPLLHPRANHFLQQGLRHLNQNNYENALRNFEEAIRLYPQFSTAYLNRGVIYLQQKDYQHAFEDFTRTIEIGNFRTSLWAYFNRGMTYYVQKDFGNALTDFSDAIRLQPKFSRAYLMRGLARFEVGDLEGLVTDSNEVIRIGKPWQTVAYAHNNRAFAFIHKGDLRAAMADCNEAIRRNSRLTQSYYCRGQVHLLNHKAEAALVDFNKAIDLHPDGLTGHAGKALACYMLDQHEDAKQQWKLLIEKDSNYQDIDWLRTELDWIEPLIETAGKIIAELSRDDT